MLTNSEPFRVRGGRLTRWWRALVLIRSVYRWMIPAKGNRVAPCDFFAYDNHAPHNNIIVEPSQTTTKQQH